MYIYVYVKEGNVLGLPISLIKPKKFIILPYQIGKKVL